MPLEGPLLPSSFTPGELGCDVSVFYNLLPLFSELNHTCCCDGNRFGGDTCGSDWFRRRREGRL
jgi:hypothetical protein